MQVFSKRTLQEESYQLLNLHMFAAIFASLPN